LPLLMIVALLGGVSTGQVIRVQAVTLASALAAGSLGSTIALWREKTFQSLAMTLLVIVLWLVGWEIVASAAGAQSWSGVPAATWAAALSPWQAIQAAARPRFVTQATSLLDDPVHLFLIAFGGISILLNILAIAMIRVWNPSREVQPGRRPAADYDTADQSSPAAGRAAASVHSAGGKVRQVWDNPVLWREIRTWAFGKRIVVVRLAYWAVFAACAAVLLSTAAPNITGATAENTLPAATRPLGGLLVVGLILLNALAVTSLTNERDSRALDVLLVTDLSPKEIVFGKLGGAFYNAKEMILLPIVLALYLWFAEQITAENFLFLLGGLVVLNAFAAMLGVHSGITYANSRIAIATSIGTLLFLFLGVATCMRIMLAFTTDFDAQLAAFLGFIAGGSVAMYVALNWRTRSNAITMAASIAPMATFIAITSFLLGNYGVVFLVTTLTYGFATIAMLMPAIHVFDVATGGATAREE
jgi:hypothetical protein